MLIGILVGMLALTGGLLYRARSRRTWPRAAPVLTDEMVRQIEEAGYVDVDEPLDLDQIQEEETRFWEEQPWEEPEEW